MTANELSLDLTETVQGLAVSHIWRGDGPALFMELGALTPSEKTRRDGTPMNPTGQASIALYREWRVETPSGILCGSRSEPALQASTLHGLLCRKVLGIAVSGRLPELELSLEGDLHLTSYTADDGQPDWAIADRLQSPPRWFDVIDGMVRVGDGGPG
jgi:hypothetical protein